MRMSISIKYSTNDLIFTINNLTHSCIQQKCELYIHIHIVCVCLMRGVLVERHSGCAMFIDPPVVCVGATDTHKLYRGDLSTDGALVAARYRRAFCWWKDGCPHYVTECVPHATTNPSVLTGKGHREGRQSRGAFVGVWQLQPIRGQYYRGPGPAAGLLSHIIM